MEQASSLITLKHKLLGIIGSTLQDDGNTTVVSSIFEPRENYPAYPAFAFYSVERDQIFWVECRDKELIGIVKIIAPDYVNKAALELCHAG